MDERGRLKGEISREDVLPTIIKAQIEDQGCRDKRRKYVVFTGKERTIQNL